MIGSNLRNELVLNQWVRNFEHIHSYSVDKNIMIVQDMLTLQNNPPRTNLK